jgi:hypothetical protein
MPRGTRGEQIFKCSKCEVRYVATHEDFAENHEGFFVCTECGTEVLAWDGLRGYIKWKPLKMKPVVIEKKR